MLILEGKCPNCYGNLILDPKEKSVTCEDCGVTEKTNKKSDVDDMLLEAVEYGPKENRYPPTRFGTLLLEPGGGLAEYLKDTLRKAMKGLDLDPEEIETLRAWRLIDA